MSAARELRFAFVVDDYDAALRVFRVDDLEAASAAARAAGAHVVAAPVDTPWGDRNQRLDLPGAMQLTLFRAP